MNDIYPYPISNPHLIPGSKKEAQQAFNLLDEFRERPQDADPQTFLRGWFALFFLNQTNHPDDVDDWDEKLKPICEEAWRRNEAGEIEDDQIYCSDALQQGHRLDLDGNLSSYVVATLDGKQGYLTANFSGGTNHYQLTGNMNLAYLYPNPAVAAQQADQFALNSYEVYSGIPDKDLDCPLTMLTGKDGQ